MPEMMPDEMDELIAQVVKCEPGQVNHIAVVVHVKMSDDDDGHLRVYGCPHEIPLMIAAIGEISTKRGVVIPIDPTPEMGSAEWFNSLRPYDP